MAPLIHGLQAERVRANLAAVREEVAAAAARAGRDPREVEVLAACKYMPIEELPVLAEAGIGLVGENRAQDLQQKAAAHGGLFAWDFIGALQSKHVRTIIPHVRLIHSLASDSALRELERHSDRARPGLRVLVEVNLAGDPAKAGIVPKQLDAFIARSPFPVAGLMTMPPLADDPELSRPWFRAMRELAQERGLAELSMGTTQDFRVAVEEGATIVRIGTRLYA
ncbi:MAG TPA: YggS family pyridoxal phosphate-dependent enzyme [Solirubrobacteraceae bacterium]|jgi:pyridoxal phosphate enzyme (YggS family)|nr:YggS family pyridoxal phosphate-dependent enzyme [Solirubrobacteraceae bacterium]